MNSEETVAVGSPVQVRDKRFRINEGRHRLVAALVRRVRRSTSSQGVPRFATGTLTEPASFIRSGLRTNVARWPSILNRTSSPSLMESASHIARGIVTRPFELTRARTSTCASLLLVTSKDTPATTRLDPRWPRCPSTASPPAGRTGRRGRESALLLIARLRG